MKYFIKIVRPFLASVSINGLIKSPRRRCAHMIACMQGVAEGLLSRDAQQ